MSGIMVTRQTPELSYPLVSVYNFLQNLDGLQPVSHQPLHVFFPGYLSTLFKVRFGACAILTPFPSLAEDPCKRCTGFTLHFADISLQRKNSEANSWKISLTPLYWAV